MIFWLIVLALTAVTVLVLAAGLWWRRGKARRDIDQEIAIYKDQLAEIDRDRARGTITPEEESAARLEVERRLIAAGRRRDKAEGRSSESRAIALTSVVMIGLLPLAAGLIYLSRGAPERIGERDVSSEAREILQTIAENPGDTRPVIRRLSRDLQGDLDDPRKWLVLGRALYASGRLDEAIPAYETAVTLTRSEDPAIFAEYTQVLVEALEARLARNPDALPAWRQLADIRLTQGDLAEAQDAYEEVLRLAPDDAQARAALGIDAFSTQN